MGMPESWWCRGARSMLGLRVEFEEGRDSMKVCKEPRRRGATAAVVEQEERRRRDLERVKPATVLMARERDIVCECCEAPSCS